MVRNWRHWLFLVGLSFALVIWQKNNLFAFSPAVLGHSVLDSFQVKAAAVATSVTPTPFVRPTTSQAVLPSPTASPAAQLDDSQPRVGVGVGTGKIKIDEAMLPGRTYQLPPLNILNTGNVSAEYTTVITYHEKQTEKMPPAEWFHFSPAQYTLEPQQSQIVTINVTVPLSVEPGEYFAYLEAHPLKTVASDQGTLIGVAAASRLYFSIKPANFVMALYYRVTGFYLQHTALVNGILLALVIFLLLSWLRKHVDISLKKKE